MKFVYVIQNIHRLIVHNSQIDLRTLITSWVSVLYNLYIELQLMKQKYI